MRAYDTLSRTTCDYGAKKSNSMTNKTNARTDRSYERAQRLFIQAEQRNRNVLDLENRRLEEMRAKSDRLRRLREERDA